jgi:ADP-ribose pyrophosphatase YjhB (NUDIX family)
MSYLDVTGKPVRAPSEVRAGVSAVILNECGELLLEERSDFGFWGLPGGALNVGESIDQTVMREVLEETGLRVVVKRLVGVYSDPRQYGVVSYPDGNVFQTVVFCLECVSESGQLRLSSESTDIGYFPVDALPPKTLPAHHVHIRDALENRPEAFVR